jgi:hypothetical protein
MMNKSVVVVMMMEKMKRRGTGSIVQENNPQVHMSSILY